MVMVDVIFFLSLDGFLCGKRERVRERWAVVDFSRNPLVKNRHYSLSRDLVKHSVKRSAYLLVTFLRSLL